MFDINKMMGTVKDLQEKVKDAQSELNNIIIEEETGGGMVKAKFNGNKQLLELEIDESLFQDEDKDFLKDLLIACINKGIVTSESRAKEHIQNATKGLIPNIPGFNFNF